MKVYNTLTRQKEDFKTVHENEVRMYVRSHGTTISMWAMCVPGGFRHLQTLHAV